MNIYTEPERRQWEELSRRPSAEDAVITGRVKDIIEKVRQGGDAAIIQLTKDIDGISMSGLEVTEEEFIEADAKVTPAVKDAIARASENIRKFHEAQLMTAPVEVETSPGVKCMQKSVPIRSIGLYIPGGTAPLFSTVLMLAIPAKVAGCPETVLCTPVSRVTGKVAPEVLYAARQCGIDKVFKVGGAQAIAAMALGTESVPRVCKIFGPGNRYVTTAKQLLGNREVAIDMPAGPSEVLVMADGTANPAFVAADLLSQAEHGADSQVVLVCNDQKIAESVLEEVRIQTAALPRNEIAEKALANSLAVVFESREKCIGFTECYAPEHLIISMEDPWQIAGQITAAGSVFVGNWSPESAGDYASGTNHTLPTCAWARSYSGLNTESFMRRITFQELTQKGLQGLAPTITAMAEAEGLDAHANAVKVRIANGKL